MRARIPIVGGGTVEDALPGDWVSEGEIARAGLALPGGVVPEEAV